VADFDKLGAATRVWNVFEVNCVTGEIRVLVDPAKRKWASLEAWQATSP
jgi:hypothetical protein